MQIIGQRVPAMLGNACLTQLKLLGVACGGSVDLTGLPALEALAVAHPNGGATARQPLHSLRTLEVRRPVQARSLAGAVPNLRCLAVTRKCEGAQLDALLQEFSGVEALACVGAEGMELSPASWRRLAGLQLLQQDEPCTMPHVSAGQGGWAGLRCALGCRRWVAQVLGGTALPHYFPPTSTL